MDGGVDGALYIIAARAATSTCAASVGASAGGTGATAGLTAIGAPATPRLCAQIFSLLSRLLGRVFLFAKEVIFNYD